MSTDPRIEYRKYKPDVYDNRVPIAQRPKSLESSKDRSASRGVNNWIAKLTWERVRVIRQRWRDRTSVPVTKSQLARDNEVTFDTIHQVLLFATWRPEFDPDGPQGHYE